MSKARCKSQFIYHYLSQHLGISRKYDIIKAVTNYWLTYCAISADLPHC